LSPWKICRATHKRILANFSLFQHTWELNHHLINYYLMGKDNLFDQFSFSFSFMDIAAHVGVELRDVIGSITTVRQYTQNI
ncbi:hypothetical protein ACJX0J_020639, partial [Zea mays]